MVTMLLRIVQVADSDLVQSNHYFYSDISTFPNSLHTSENYKFNDRCLAFPSQFTIFLIFFAI